MAPGKAPTAVVVRLVPEPFPRTAAKARYPNNFVRTALPRVHAGMSTPADDADKTENDVRRTEEAIQQGTDQDQELPTETKPAGPLPDFNT